MKKGFTLIETFVAITILLISLSGPLSIAAQSLRSAYYARDEITAFYLAQEGLEFVRAFRDQNYLYNAANPGSPQRSWLTGLDSVCIANACEVDFPNFPFVQACGTGTQPACGPMVTDANGLFEYEYKDATTHTTAFTRTLTITPVAGTTDEDKVTVTVTWISAGISRTFTISEDLFNWL